MPKYNMKAHKAVDFKVGDTVKLFGLAEDHEDGWDNTWNDYMTKLIGRTGVVEGDGGRSGYNVRIGGQSWGYPYWVLKKVIKEPIEVRLNDYYTATVYEDKVQVGCQTFDIKVFRDVFKKMGI